MPANAFAIDSTWPYRAIMRLVHILQRRGRVLGNDLGECSHSSRPFYPVSRCVSSVPAEGELVLGCRPFGCPDNRRRGSIGRHPVCACRGERQRQQEALRTRGAETRSRVARRGGSCFSETERGDTGGRHREPRSPYYGGEKNFGDGQSLIQTVRRGGESK